MSCLHSFCNHKWGCIQQKMVSYKDLKKKKKRGTLHNIHNEVHPMCRGKGGTHPLALLSYTIWHFNKISQTLSWRLWRSILLNIGKFEQPAVCRLLFILHVTQHHSVFLGNIHILCVILEWLYLVGYRVGWWRLDRWNQGDNWLRQSRWWWRPRGSRCALGLRWSQRPEQSHWQSPVRPWRWQSDDWPRQSLRDEEPWCSRKDDCPRWSREDEELRWGAWHGGSGWG